ncbi:Pentatricopeptide repeat-containing protein [Canna indica]|uniref:Pentatricopeptide repeat-containing protein n=1 Tax=Canna indica TaxID=4628 RepID=A0AAQ3JWA2_9LILI|nr:Pentatricopeptide repeat-containing protein [Canna indica]
MSAALGNQDTCKESRRVFDSIPGRDLIYWTSTICGYGTHGLAKDAKLLFIEMVESGVGPDGITFIGLLTGFSHKGMANRWDGVARMRLLMKQQKISKPPRCSSIEAGGQVHTFLAFERSHTRCDEI